MKTLEDLLEIMASAPLAFRDGERHGPVAATALADVESRLALHLPSDVRAFYSKMDGTDIMDASHGLISLWPIVRWKRVSEEAPEYATAPLADAIAFADHSLWCWAYAARFEHGGERMAIYLVGGRSDHPIAENFTEFLELIITNSRRLYGEAG
jgi:hypothetical protein